MCKRDTLKTITRLKEGCPKSMHNNNEVPTVYQYGESSHAFSQKYLWPVHNFRQDWRHRKVTLNYLYILLWSGKVPEDQKKINTLKILSSRLSQYMENWREVRLISVSEKLVEQILLKTISKHMKMNKMGIIQYGLMRRKSSLTSLKDFYNQI